MSGYHISSGNPEAFGLNQRSIEDQCMELEIQNSCLQRLIVELLFNNQRLRDTRSTGQSNATSLGEKLKSPPSD